MKQISFKRICFFSAILALVSLSNAFGGTLNLVTGEWAPFTSEQMEGKGMCSEIVSAAARKMHMNVDIKFVPWKRCEHSIVSGKAWAAFPYSKTEERLKKYVYSAPIATSETRFFYYGTPKLDNWTVLEDFKDVKMGGLLGYFYEEKFKKAGIHADMNSDPAGAWKKLIAGRIDFFPQNELVGRATLKKDFPDHVSRIGVLGKSLSVSKLHLIADRTDGEAVKLIHAFDTALETIKSTGEYADILRSYGLSQ
tara:strand:- start:586 stop:1341 length:756 start_codon:yes stop_codon:yes gene_type:complete